MVVAPIFQIFTLCVCTQVEMCACRFFWQPRAITKSAQPNSSRHSLLYTQNSRGQKTPKSQNSSRKTKNSNNRKTAHQFHMHSAESCTKTSVCIFRVFVLFLSVGRPIIRWHIHSAPIEAQHLQTVSVTFQLCM